MGLHLWTDSDLLREAREDRRRDEPDASELLRMQAEVERSEQERAGMPIGTRIAGKAA